MQQNEKLYIGIISGTSLDSVDISLIGVSGNNIKQYCNAEYNFPKKLKAECYKITNSGNINISAFGQLDIKLGKLFANSIVKFIKENKINKESIDAIGSHGQTIFHDINNDAPFTIQLGCAHTIASITGITTVYNFRAADIAKGGQGAPLAPILHEKIFSCQNEDRVILNLGGIANITLLKKKHRQAQLGYDTGPANCLLDYWCQKHKKTSYDDRGLWAKSGKVNNELLTLIMGDPFFTKPFPKSTGREYFNEEWLKQIIAKFSKTSPADIQATLLEATVETSVREIKKHITSGSIIICGGGVHNTTLINRLEERILEHSKEIKLMSSNQLGFDPSYIESLLFAWLAYCNISGISFDLGKITGSKKEAILGSRCFS